MKLFYEQKKKKYRIDDSLYPEYPIPKPETGENCFPRDAASFGSRR